MLTIDTEGYDYEIIKQVFLTEIKPKIILYEHKLLSIKDRTDSKKLLKNCGYNVKELDTGDRLCILKK